MPFLFRARELATRGQGESPSTDLEELHNTDENAPYGAEQLLQRILQLSEKNAKEEEETAKYSQICNYAMFGNIVKNFPGR